MTARTVIDVLLAALACSALIIGSMVFLLGANATATLFSDVLSALGIQSAYAGGLEHANTDSEMRFFAVFWFGFGLWIIDRLRADPSNRRWVVIAAALFWVGGFGRLLSFWHTGTWPDPLFIGLMWIELIAPVLLLILFMKERSALVGEIR